MTKKPQPRVTAFLDQAEFLGGAEYFLLDFFNALTSEEIRRLSPIIIGGKNRSYQSKVPNNIPIISFDYPAVNGSIFHKFLALFNLFFTAFKLKKILKKQGVTQVFTNTPRTHFIMWMVRFWGYKGRWNVFFHDFTTRPLFLVNLVANSADALIANSMPTRQWLKQSLKKKNHAKIKIIENGIDTENLPEQKFPESITRVLNLGRIDPLKGQKYFVEAADLLLERNPDLEFSIIGDPVDENLQTKNYEQEIKTFAKTRKLENLKFFPSVENPLETINQYDLLVFTPTEPETFGRVIIEALALGKMVVAFDQTGPKEILNSFMNQFPETKDDHFSPLVEVENSMSLAETIGYYADNPKKISPFVENGPNFVKTNFDLSETKKRLLEVLL